MQYDLYWSDSYIGGMAGLFNIYLPDNPSPASSFAMDSYMAIILRRRGYKHPCRFPANEDWGNEAI
jgi:hypothetical protein